MAVRAHAWSRTQVLKTVAMATGHRPRGPYLSAARRATPAAYGALNEMLRPFDNPVKRRAADKMDSVPPLD